MANEAAVIARRMVDGPIIGPDLDPSIGVNIQGPSLIRVPDWVEAPLGRYYLYFADHKGAYIRLAVADALTGPWRIHRPGTLHLRDSLFPVEPLVPTAAELADFEGRYRARGAAISHDVLSEITTPHIASPDVHVDHAARRIVMYYHGLERVGTQLTRAAVSADGISFAARPGILSKSYLRVFSHDGWYYGMAMPGQFHRSRDGLDGFEDGPLLFNPDMRHAAILKRGNALFVFWTRVGDAPESILMSRLDITGDWMGWRDEPPVTVLRPERPWEGAQAACVPSVRSTAYGMVNQLRDPAIFEEDGRVYLLYAVAGESGIGIAELLVRPG